MNVSLTPKLEAFVRRKVASGLYNNASEVIREALRLLVERDGQAPRQRPAAKKDALRAGLAALEAPLRRRGVVSAALFGSVVRGEAGPESDVDVLVEVAPEARFSLLDLVELKAYLEEELGRGVDVATRDGLDPALEERVLREAERVFP